MKRLLLIGLAVGCLSCAKNRTTWETVEYENTPTPHKPQQFNIEHVYTGDSIYLPAQQTDCLIEVSTAHTKIPSWKQDGEAFVVINGKETDLETHIIKVRCL